MLVLPKGLAYVRKVAGVTRDSYSYERVTLTVTKL